MGSCRVGQKKVVVQERVASVVSSRVGSDRQDFEIV